MATRKRLLLPSCLIDALSNALASLSRVSLLSGVIIERVLGSSTCRNTWCNGFLPLYNELAC